MSFTAEGTLSPTSPRRRALDVVRGVGSAVAIGAGIWVLWRALRGADGVGVDDIVGFGACAIGVAVAQLASAASCALIARGAGIPSPATHTALAALAGTPGKYLPGKVGSLALRAAWLHRVGVDKGPALAVVSVEVAVALAVAVVLAVIALGASFRDMLARAPALPMVAAVVIVVVVVAVAAIVVRRRHLQLTQPDTAGAQDGVSALSVPTTFAAVVVVDVAGWLAQGAGLALCLYVVGADAAVDIVGVVGVVGVVAASAVVGVLSPAPAGVGVREVGAVSLLAMLSVPDAPAARAVLLWRVASVSVELVAGGLAIIVLRRVCPAPQAQAS
jgi:uncharacterized membrane protein YbhN (UPF0104 family)